MFGRILALIIILCSACTQYIPPVEYVVNYENSKEAAISAWEQEMDWVSDWCVDWLDSVEVIEYVDNAHCPVNAIGCMIVTKPFVYVRSDLSSRQRLRVVAHEYIHHIEMCELPWNYYKGKDIEFSGKDDHHYNNIVWGTQKTSVEQLSRDIVLKLSRTDSVN